MKLIPIRSWVRVLAVGCATMAAANCLAGDLPLRLVASDPNNPSLFDSMGAGFKRGVDNVTSFFKPKPKEPPPVNDSISLSNKARGGPELHVAMARLYEETDRKAEAAKEYQQALKLGPKDPQVLAAYAQFKARSAEYEEAIKFYQQALRLTPDDPALSNDMALCFARRERYPEALSHMSRAIQLQPGNALYQNNIAAVLVEIGQQDEALRHLRAVHPEAVAHYNLGYLLHKKGQSVAAAQQFAYALQKDPSLEAAKYWLNRIGAQGGEGLASAPWIGSQPATTAVGQTVLSPAPVTSAPPAMALPRVGGTSESAPLPPAISTVPANGYADPRAQQAPVVGRSPAYDAEVRRQGFVEVVDSPHSRATTKRLPPPDDEPAPLPDDRVPRSEPNRTQPVRRLPPPVEPTLK